MLTSDIDVSNACASVTFGTISVLCMVDDTGVIVLTLAVGVVHMSFDVGVTVLLSTTV